MQTEQQIRVLYIADSQRATAVDRLQNDRFSIEHVDADGAGQHLDDEQFDCVVLDGIDDPATLIDRLRDHKRSIPIVLRTDDDAIADAIDAGVTGVVPRHGDDQCRLLRNRIADAVEAQRSTHSRERRQLEQLQRMTRGLMDAPAAAIPEQAVTFARSVLDLPITALALVSEGELTVVAATERAEELFASIPSFNGREGIALRAFHEGVPIVADDAREHPHVADPETLVRSVGIFPIGEHGVLITGSPEPGVLDETDVNLGSLLASSIESALDRAEREQQLRERSDELTQTTQTLEAVIEAAPVPIVALDRQRRVELWNPAAERLFGWDVEEVAGEWAPIVPEERREEFEETIDAVLDGETVAREEVVRRTKSGDRLELQLSTAPLRDADGEIRGSLGVFLDISEHKAYERRLNALHETTRELMGATDRQAIARIASDAIEGVLDHPLNAVRYLNEEQQRLEAVAVTEQTTDRLGERPSKELADSDAGAAYRDGETRQSIGVDVQAGSYHRLHVPIGEHGVLSMGSSSRFEESDVQLAEVLAANVETALDRVERQRRLERQNERLEQFASVVSHDLRSPLNVAQGYVGLLQEQYDDDALDRVAAAHERMSELIEMVLTLARQGEAVGETEPTELAQVAHEAWSLTSTSQGRLELDDPGTIRADPGRLRQLLENLFRNAIEHADPDVTVRFGSLPDEGFYVADDGPGLDEPDRVFERGYSTDENGSGFGLAIVNEIAAAHGWEITATESDTGGARFEIYPNEHTICEE